jgi:hypothetical protein
MYVHVGRELTGQPCITTSREGLMGPEPFSGQVKGETVKKRERKKDIDTTTQYN